MHESNTKVHMKPFLNLILKLDRSWLHHARTRVHRRDRDTSAAGPHTMQARHENALKRMEQDYDSRMEEQVEGLREKMRLLRA